jgi:hypothetical protein
VTINAAAQFKADIEKLVATAEWLEGKAISVDYVGEVVEPTLEHNVRRHFLDELLTTSPPPRFARVPFLSPASRRRGRMIGGEDL